MFKYKMFKFKVVYLALAIIFILLVYKDVIEIICFFDTGAEDLSNAGGEYIKMQIIKTEMSLEIGLFNFFFYSSFVMPIVICLMGFDYSLIKKNYLIFSIGKNNKYDSYLKILKTIFAGISTGIYIVVFFAVLIFAKIFGEFEIFLNDGMFKSGSVLSKIIATPATYLVFLVLSGGIAVYINALFYLYLVDKLEHLAKSILVFLGFIWIGSMIMYNFLPYFLVPMSTLMIASYGNLTFTKCLLPYMLYIIGFIILSRKQREVLC